MITFTDDAFTRDAFTGGVLAITTVKTASFTNGTIVGYHYFFSPLVQFSTNLAAGTYDLQAILTHELGHSLGANHTNIFVREHVLSQQILRISRQRNLTPDDVAFVNTSYPALGGNGYGTYPSGTTTV